MALPSSFGTPSKGPERVMQPGQSVTITGTLREENGNTAIVNATYLLGALATPYDALFSKDFPDIKKEEYESVFLRLGGNVPSSNCSSGCNIMSVCLHSCFSCSMLDYQDFSQTGTFDYGTYDGVLVAKEPLREFWFFASSESGDDVCL